MMKSSRYAAYVGYDMVRWLTTYAVFGQSKTRLDDFEYGSSKALYGLGIRFNLLEQEILDPTLFEDTIRVHGSVQYVATGGEFLREEMNWRELDAALILSIVNEVEGNKDYLPFAIAVFVGPLYSNITSNDDLQEEGDTLGIIGGLEVFYTQRVSFDVGVESFDATGYFGGINVRF